MALAESAGISNMPAAVSHALAGSLATVAGEEPRTDVVSQLSVGDRQFLMRQLELLLGHDLQWHSFTCRKCAARSDFQIELSRLPVKEATQGYPHVEVDTSQGSYCFRIPNGSDQEAIATIENEYQAFNVLLSRCLVTSAVDSAESEIVFSEQDRLLIEAELERIAPEVGCEIAAACIECGSQNVIALDPYAVIGKSNGSIYSDIHKLACHYHWGEEEILSLPRKRRQYYLKLIEMSRGMAFEGSAG